MTLESGDYFFSSQVKTLNVSNNWFMRVFNFKQPISEENETPTHGKNLIRIIHWTLSEIHQFKCQIEVRVWFPVSR